MSDIEFDFSELNQVGVDIGRASEAMLKNTAAAMKTSGFRGKKAWAAAAQANVGTHLPAYPASIDYDFKSLPDGFEVEIGPNLERNQGPLGIVEDAPGGVNARPQRNYQKALDVVNEDLVKGILIAADQAAREIE